LLFVASSHHLVVVIASWNFERAGRQQRGARTAGDAWRIAGKIGGRWSQRSPNSCIMIIQNINNGDDNHDDISNGTLTTAFTIVSGASVL
jgi:hypothetical protein